jgi:hypothetical protein
MMVCVGWVERTRETHRMPREGLVGLTSTFDPPYNTGCFIFGGLLGFPHALSGL